MHELEHQPGLACGDSFNMDGEASGIVLDEGRDALGLGLHLQVVVIDELYRIAVVVHEMDVDMVGGLPLVDFEGGVVAAPHLRVAVVDCDRLSIQHQLDTFSLGTVDVHLEGFRDEVRMARSYGSMHEAEHQPGLACGDSFNVEGEASGIVLEEGHDAGVLGHHLKVEVIAERHGIAAPVHESDIDMAGELPRVDLEGVVPRPRGAVVRRDRPCTQHQLHAFDVVGVVCRLGLGRTVAATRREQQAPGNKGQPQSRGPETASLPHIRFLLCSDHRGPPNCALFAAARCVFHSGRGADSGTHRHGGAVWYSGPITARRKRPADSSPARRAAVRRPPRRCRRRPFTAYPRSPRTGRGAAWRPAVPLRISVCRSGLRDTLSPAAARCSNCSGTLGPWRSCQPCWGWAGRRPRPVPRPQGEPGLRVATMLPLRPRTSGTGERPPPDSVVCRDSGVCL